MTDVLDSYAAEWERARQRREGASGETVERVREAAWHRFLSLGFPTTRDEDWRFTSVAPIAERSFTLAAPPTSDPRDVDVGAFRLSGEVATELVFVDGHYVPALSRLEGLPPGSRVESLRAALAADPGAIDQYLARIAPFERHAFVALNTAFLGEGACIQLPPRVVLQQPIHLLFLSADSSVSQPVMVHPRVLVVAWREQSVFDRGDLRGPRRRAVLHERRHAKSSSARTPRSSTTRSSTRARKRHTSTPSTCRLSAVRRARCTRSVPAVRSSATTSSPC